MTITITHIAMIDQLIEALRDSTHRTNHGEFLWRSIWDSSIIMQQIALEMLIKDEKRHLRLDEYRVRRYQAVVRHLLLMDIAYACLPHVGIKACRAQGQNKTKKVLRLELISKLKGRMRQIVWQDNVRDVIRYNHEKSVIRRLEKLRAA